MAKDDEELPPIGDDTEAYLTEAKQGKPRFFMLVCKGPQVKYLAVKKKPVKAAALTEAKKQGYKGEGYFGTITGKGMDLVFNLAVSDGYDKEPCKDKLLKDFIEEHAKVKCKPAFLVVETPPVVPFDDDDLKHPLVAKFMKLDVVIVKILDAKPELEAEIQARVVEIRELLQAAEFDGAGTKIDDFVKYLGEKAAPPPPSPPPQLSPEAQKLADRIKPLRVEVDKAATRGATNIDELKAVLAESLGLLKEKKVADAHAKLDRLEELLKAAQPGTATPGSKAAAIFTTRLKNLKPDIDKAVASGEGTGPQIKLLVSEAATLARKGDFAGAIALLDRIGALLDRGTTSDESESGETGSSESETSSGSTVVDETTTTSETDDGEKADPDDDGDAEESLASTGDEESTWNDVAAEFSLQRQLVTKWNPEGLKAFEKAIAQATKLAASGDFAGAIRAVDPIFELVTAASRARNSADADLSVEDGVVAFRSALLRWNKAVSDVTTELQSLQDAMRKKLPQSSKLAGDLETVLDEFNLGLDIVLTDGIGAKDVEAQKPIYESARMMIRDFQSKATTNELIKHLDSCTFAKVDIRGILTTALDELTLTLAG